VNDEFLGSPVQIEDGEERLTDEEIYGALTVSVDAFLSEMEF
jgi:hypothetical protein